MGDMSSTPKAIKSLREYYKDRRARADIKHLMSELRGESDRAVVILMSAFLDDELSKMLSRAFAERMAPQEIDYAFRFEGPLGSFAARIEVAHLFGYIDSDARAQLDTLRELRNACAHSKRQIDFSLPVLAAVTKRMLRSHEGAPDYRDSPMQTRIAFIFEAVFLMAVLRDGRAEAETWVSDLLRQSVSRPPSPDKPLPP